jgi:hypothetical protein
MDTTTVFVNLASLALFGLGSLILLALVGVGAYELATGQDVPPRPRRTPWWSARVDGAVNLAIVLGCLVLWAGSLGATGRCRSSWR